MITVDDDRFRLDIKLRIWKAFQMAIDTKTYISPEPTVRSIMDAMGDNPRIERPGEEPFYITERWLEAWVQESRDRYLANPELHDTLAEIVYELHDTPVRSMEYGS